MKPGLLLMLTLFVPAIFGGQVANAQDYIRKQDGTVLSCKILEVSSDHVRFVYSDMKNGPVFEVKKDEILSIRYRNGLVEKYTDESKKDSTLQNQLKTNGSMSHGPVDTTKYSTLYILFDSGSDETQVFPLYLNGQFILKLRNHMRLTYKIYSEGPILIERRGRSYGEDIKTSITAKYGESYAINIIISDPQKLLPIERFLLEKFTDSLSVKKFLDLRFLTFKAYRGSDVKLLEDIRFPLIP